MFRDRPALLTLVLLLALISLPYIGAMALAPADKVFLQTFYNPQDTSVYLATMRAGARGEWLRTLPFTNEPQEPVLYYPFYLLLGHIAPPTALTYHAARLITTILMALALWALLAETLSAGQERHIAFVLSLLGMGLGWLVVVSGLWQVIRPTDLYAPTSTLIGASLANPHFPLAVALQCLILTLYLRARQTPYRPGTLLAAALAGLALSLTLPFQFFLTAAILMADAVVESLRARVRQAHHSPVGAKPDVEGAKPRASGLPPIIVGGLFVDAVIRARGFAPTAVMRAAGLIVLPGGVVLFYYLMLSRIMPFWSQLIAQWPLLEHQFRPLDYIAGYGLTLGFALIGAAALWRRIAARRSAGEQLLLVWLAVNGLLIIGPLDFSDRMSLGFGIVLAALSAIALARVIPLHSPRLPWLRRFAPASAGPYRQAQAKPSAFVVLVLALVVSSAITLAGTLPLVALSENDLPYYLSKDDAAAIEWLGANAGRADLVLAAPQIGNLIPALTDARIYAGHLYETFQAERKSAQTRVFFDSATSDDARRDFLWQQGVTLVYVHPGAYGQGDFDGTGAPFLKPVFRAGAITLYRVDREAY
ncbi:MAG: hypothetical protein HYR71_08040 [Chloroflexi bacterium]|nr:hypothetical protein [Chloroflexota bacterium]